MRQVQQAASDPNGWPAIVVEASLDDLLEGRARDEAGKDHPIVRAMVEEGPGPVTMGHESIRPRPTNAFALAARYDLRKTREIHHV